MRYVLVATTGYLLLVDLQTRITTPIESNRPEYYGISWFPHDDELVLSHSGLDNGTLVDIATYARSERGWLSNGVHASRELLSQPHQIICAPDGRVVCTNTGRNAVTVIDLNRPGHFQEARLGNERWDRLSLRETLGDHLNSVFLRGTKLYVMAHRFSKGSQIGVFDYPSLELDSITSINGKSGLHNIWVTSDAQWIACLSENGAVMDVKADKVLWEAGVPIYTRGLAANRQFVLVGESQRTGRDLRRGSMSGLWILDRETWKALDYICLGPYGAVNEVRIADEPDEAHHGAPFSGLHRLLASDLPRQWSRMRLDAAQAAFAARDAWSGMDLVFGSPETLGNGARHAADANICLALRTMERCEDSMVFDYEIDAMSRHRHVSAVLGYRGAGDDTNMVALLLQPTAESASLTIWAHRGEGWSRDGNFRVDGLPLQGRAVLTATKERVTFTIDGEVVIEANADGLGLEDCALGVGIRWCGATVLPMPPH